MPLLADDADSLGTSDVVTHRLFQQKKDGAVKIVLEP